MYIQDYELFVQGEIKKETQTMDGILVWNGSSVPKKDSSYTSSVQLVIEIISLLWSMYRKFSRVGNVGILNMVVTNMLSTVTRLYRYLRRDFLILVIVTLFLNYSYHLYLGS